MDRKISVVVPIYNVEKYLRQCLDSIVNQTYKNLEIILVDDGSPDNCGAICDEYAAKDDRITVIHKQNGGLSAAWNDGMRKSTGEWIAFIDSDDWIDVDYFEKIMEKAHCIGITDTDVIIAGGRIDEKKKSKVVHNFTESAKFCTPEERTYLKIRIHVPMRTDKGEKLAVLGYPWDKLFRLSFLRENNLWYDESLNGCADMLFDYETFDLARKVIGCDYYGYHYRFVTTGVSKKYTPYRPNMFHDYINKLYSYIDAHGGASPQIVDAINTAAITYIADSLRSYYFHPQNPDSYRETANKIRMMKEMPRYRTAIIAKNNRYLAKKQLVLKCALQLPWVWPIKALYIGNKIVSQE